MVLASGTNARMLVDDVGCVVLVVVNWYVAGCVGCCNELGSMYGKIGVGESWCDDVVWSSDGKCVVRIIMVDFC
jgi:hypothetical protein